jgi:hypothetical protein
MSRDVIGSLPRSFYVTAGLALVWNAFGLLQYVMRVTMTDAAIAALPADQQAFINTTPSWALAAFAIATNAGVLASLLLLIKKALAYPLFVISLLGVIVQNIHALFLGNALEVYGVVGLALPATIIIVGIYFILYAKGAKRRHWIN